MKSTFFARFALPILCVVFFMTPFALRGARMGIQRMKNNVKDWLPADFPETVELEWFGRHFLGEQFVVVTWPGCTAEDPRFRKLVNLLHKEVVVHSTSDEAAKDNSGLSAAVDGKPFEELSGSEQAELERLRAREIGDEYGLTVVGDFHEDWAGRGERWLIGDNDLWYYITPAGELYQWSGRNGLGNYLARAAGSLWGQDPGEGELKATLGEPTTAGHTNEFFDDPRKLTARMFKSVVTGPDTLELLAAKDGPLWPRGVDDEFAAAEASQKALERLTGTLFGNDGEQTCIILTLSEPGKRDLRRVIGRELMGRRPGKLLELAAECGISPSDLRLGGPPVDNVAIDEEGTITLFRLIGYSMVIGLILAFVCFRSIKITIMIFFVGGVSAVTSLGIVWWCGGSVDAVLMSMPSLVYVLGLSGAVHIINYYRDAVRENGLVGAPEKALAHGWKPCTLAAFTTALGLMSLNTSNIVPIKKFGFYSAIGVMATLFILFTYLPSALELWPPGYHKKLKSSKKKRRDVQQILMNFWEPIARFIVRRYGWATVVCLVVMIAAGLGLRKINTSVQLLKLFDGDAKIIRDYEWLEANLGKLVPMELVVRVRPELMRPIDEDLASNEEPTDEAVAAANSDEKDDETGDETAPNERFQLTFLERMELASRVQAALESQFGEEGSDIVGRGMSAPTFAPDLPPPGFATAFNPTRWVMNDKLAENRDQYLASDYLRIDREGKNKGAELWRISLRLGALNNVDYGEFVAELKRVVEPILTAYQYRDIVLQGIDQQREGKGVVKAKVAFLGVSDPDGLADSESDPGDAESSRHDVDQTQLFTKTVRDLMTCAGVYAKKGCWHNPDEVGAEPEFYTSDKWGKAIGNLFDCVVLVEDNDLYDIDFIKQHAKLFIDARNHQFDPTSSTARTAAEKDAPIHVVYTGVVPIVYKAQRTLLTSLIDSIGWAFVMIAAVMMILLRSGPWSPWNLLNVRGGMLSMIPNVFPVIVIFGMMGHWEIMVDIGTMMTASVAMGVAVDDTIHFLTWFRDGISAGMPRNQAIVEAYKRCAAAMTQTTLIGGLGLAVFAFSTFTPTQCFGVMMLTLLVAALVGDLIFLPALLAGPLGKYFCPKPVVASVASHEEKLDLVEDDRRVSKDGFAEPHIKGQHAKPSKSGVFHRHDPGHGSK